MRESDGATRLYKTEKMFAFIKGPGWFPGTPRLGDPMGVPEIQVREKYNPKVAGWINVYTVLHFVLVFFAFDDLGREARGHSLGLHPVYEPCRQRRRSRLAHRLQACQEAGGRRPGDA